MQSISAHYDGTQVLLDEDIDLRPDTRLIVTILPDTDSERDDFMLLSVSSLSEAYSDDEVEYSEADIAE
jgi:hypothetical protein